MKSLLRENLSQIILAVGGLILGGVAGYYSCQIETNKAIASLSARVVAVETKAQAQYDPGYQKLNELSMRIIGMNNELKGLKDRQLLTDKLVELHLDKFQIELEKVRKETIHVLSEFIVKAQNKEN